MNDVFILKNYVLGVLEDNVSLLSYPDLYSYWGADFAHKIGFPFGVLFQLYGGNEPVFQSLYFIFASIVGSVLVYNILTILAVVLNGIFSGILFKHFLSTKGYLIFAFLGIIYSFSPYHYYQYRSHLVLFQSWLVVLFLYLYTKSPTKLGLAKLGIGLAIMGGISNYLFYLSILFISCYSILHISIIWLFTRSKDNLKVAIQSYVILISTALLTLLLILSPFLSSNILYNTSNNQVSSVVETTASIQDNINTPPSESPEVDLSVYARSLEEFFYFTSRPWYYFLPSSENPWFGGLTNKAINWLQNDWGYWLTSNYFPSEHSASYLGYVNFLFAILGLVYVLKKLKVNKVIKFKLNYFTLNRFSHDEIEKNVELKKYLNVFVLGLVAVVLVILTMPPYFTISLHKIYMPSYLLWGVFPMFRVLARMGILILLIQLIYTGFGYIYFLEILKSKVLKLKVKSSLVHKFISFLVKKWEISSFFILLPFVILSLMEFYVPITLTDVSTPPAVFTYIKNNTPADSVIAVYPYSKTKHSLFWMREFNRALVNPMDYVYGDYDSKEFTSDLINCEGLRQASTMGVGYLLYFNVRDNNASLGFFEGTKVLDRVLDIGEGGYTEFSNRFFTMVNAGNTPLNSAILYKFKNGKVCENIGVKE